MTKLLEEAIAKLRELPDEEQEQAATELMRYLSDVPSAEDTAAIAKGRAAYQRGEFTPLEQWRHDVGLSNH
jgi:hypothetical protein